MSDRSYDSHNISYTRAFEYDREIQLLEKMESVRLRKKAAFDELLRYTYSNVKEPVENNNGNESGNESK